MTTVETTRPLPPAGSAPPPPAGLAPQKFRVGDRVTYMCTDHPDGPTQMVGDVTASNSWLFDVRWAGGDGTGRFAHGHEPDTLRPAADGDAPDVRQRVARAAARELLRLVELHPLWPPDVQRALRARATELSR